MKQEYTNKQNDKIWPVTKYVLPSAVYKSDCVHKHYIASNNKVNAVIVLYNKQ